jgi:predicted acylesterase/phospholipase RssA
MVRMFVEDAEASLDPSTMMRPPLDQWWEALRTAPAAAGEAFRAELDEGMRGPRAILWRAFERVARRLPAGLLDARPAERTLQRLFAEPGRTNDFRALRAALRVVATDIDTGAPVAFGGPGYDRVPISRAVLASSALPGVFPPVRIDGRYFVDGALNKTLHASVALDEGVGLLFCVNPLVPYASPPTAQPGRVARAGLGAILAQSLRTMIRSRMTAGLAKYGVTHPEARIVLFEPRSDDTAIFFTSIFTVSSRRRVCEHAYQQTRLELRTRSEALSAQLGPYGMALNRGILEDHALTLVRTTPPPVPRRAGGLEDTTLRLRHTLDDLERSLRIAQRA